MALCQQDDLEIDRLELLYSRRFQKLAESVVEDIRQVSPKTQVRLHELTLRDPWALDEVYEALNLVLTRTIDPIPIVLVGSDYWGRMLDLDYLIAGGYIEAKDKALVYLTDSGADAAAYVLARCGCGKDGGS